MDAELKAKWIAALRSGEYEQARYKLADSAGGFCCLGVLCVVAEMPISPDGERVDTAPEGDSYGPINSLIGTEHQSEELTRLNDSGRESFSEIADYIEKNL